MQPYFFSANGALAVLQYATPTDHRQRSLRIDIERSRHRLNVALVLLWSGVLIMTLFIRNPWGVLESVISLIVLIVLIFFKPYHWLDEEAVLQNKLCRGELRNTYVTSLDPSFMVVVDNDGKMLYPLEKSRPFLKLPRVIELDRELRQECRLTSDDIRYRFALWMELINLGREVFGDSKHLDVLEQDLNFLSR